MVDGRLAGAVPVAAEVAPSMGIGAGSACSTISCPRHEIMLVAVRPMSMWCEIGEKRNLLIRIGHFVSHQSSVICGALAIRLGAPGHSIEIRGKGTRWKTISLRSTSKHWIAIW